jgi:hypothetical protein
MAPDQRDHWLLQKRVTYAPLVQTSAGPRYTELRVMVLWPESAPKPAASFTWFRMNTTPRHSVSQMRDSFTGSGLVWFG